MPSPVGHTLAGCCLAAAAADRAPALRSPAFVAALLVAANLPDIDFAALLLGGPAAGLHQAGTHSVAFVLAAALLLALVLRGTAPPLQAWRWLAAAGLVHLGLDLVNYDSLPPIGIPLAWPFSDTHWHSPVILFPGTDRSHPFSATNLRELGAELGWLLPPLLFLLRGRIAGAFRRERAVKILVVAPQPFYRERGTPIAVRLLAETLCALGHAVDLLVYHEGEQIAFPGLRLLRAPAPPLVHDVPIGFSLKKLACDLFLTGSFVRLARPGRYDVVHAVEEAVFPATWLRRRHRAAVVCDMDSDLVDQLVGASRVRGLLRRTLEAIVRRTLRACDLVLAVCPRLAERARALCPAAPVRVLEDIPLTDRPAGPVEDLRARYGVDRPLALYVGNLERYQGIDLLLDALAALGPEAPATLVVIGGSPTDIARYGGQVAARGLDARVRFAGPRPLRDLGGYLAQADILVSPRTLGENTPMKIYSYLASGRSILATDIGSHTQALDASCALLVPPEAGCLADGLRRLAADPGLRERLGGAGAARAAERYSREAYREKLRDAYALLAPVAPRTEPGP